jgi:3D (Asp-Asp-Asp) domain-containing protein
MSIIRVAAGVALVSLVACSDGSSSTPKTTGTGQVQTDGVGSLNFELQLPDGTNISTVNYTVSGGPQNVTRSGEIDVANSTKLSFRIGNLPVGTGYTMALAATTSAGVSCGGSANFAVENNEVTALTMDLVCGGAGGSGVGFDVDSNGDVTVTVTVVNDGGTSGGGGCPLVSGISALPAETKVGSSVSLEGYPTSTNGVSYSWQASTGAFSSPTAAATKYTCQSAGDQTLTFQITKSGCTPSSKPVTVTCTGDGTVVDSGTGVVEDSGTVVVDSGTGVVEDSGTVVVDSGTVVVDSGTVVVDSGTGVVDSGTGGGGGWPVGSAACAACQQTNCTAYFDENPFGACTDSLCQQVMACTYDKKCFTNLQNIPDCYCGTGNTVSVCQQPDFVPTGACKDIIAQGLESTVNMTILERYINPQYAAGRAGQLATCIADLCITDCALPQ